jgi:hypothetical protein
VRRIPTTTRAWCLLLTYALLLFARVAHAAAPAPDHADPAPAVPVISADCGPCDNPDHDHSHAHAHDDHCPVCQTIRAGLDHAPVCLGAGVTLDPTLVGFITDAPRATGAVAITSRSARAPPVR